MNEKLFIDSAVNDFCNRKWNKIAYVVSVEMCKCRRAGALVMLSTIIQGNLLSRLTTCDFDLRKVYVVN